MDDQMDANTVFFDITAVRFMSDWIVENIHGDWRLNDKVNKTYSISFADPNEAVLFRLWIGSCS